MKPTLKQRLWAFWHTRPGHTPHGLLIIYGYLYCASCGSRAPGQE